MLKSSFTYVILALFSVILLCLLIYTYHSGCYFDLRVFARFFKHELGSDAISYNFRPAMVTLRSALSAFSNYNVIGFNMSNGNTVLKILKVMANFLPYLSSIIGGIMMLLVTVVTFIFGIIGTLISVIFMLYGAFNASWVPLGTGGFIMPIPYIY